MSTKRGYTIVAHRPMCFWSIVDVEEWLKRRAPRLAVKYAGDFIRERITGRILVEMIDADLLAIGIRDANERSATGDQKGEAGQRFGRVDEAGRTFDGMTVTN